LTNTGITLYANEYMRAEFGEKIKKQRHRLDLSLRKVCEVVKNDDGKSISVSYLNDIEQGHRKPPSGRIIVQLAKVLELDPHELLNIAGKVDPEVEDAVKDVEVGVLFRRLLQKNRDDPNFFDWLNKNIDKGA